MSEPAAFKACFTDWKLIRTRSVIQLVFEIPVEQSDEAYRVLGGMPNPGNSVWCAVAKLNADEPVKLHKPVAPDKKLARQAGIACADPVFRRFLVEKGDAPDDSIDTAANMVRLCCGITSRSEIVPGSEAAKRWDDLYGQFIAWKLVA